MTNSPSRKIDFNNLIFREVSIEHLTHLRKFKCGNGSMELFLHAEAYPSHIEREASTTLVFLDNELVAYYTLKHVDLKVEPWNENDRYSFALDISRIAVASNLQGNGIGTFIVKKIFRTAYEVNERFITLDALRERVNWYCSAFDFDPMFEDDIENESSIVSLIADLYDQDLVLEYFME